MDQARLAYLRPGLFRSIVSLTLRKTRRYFQGVGGSGAPRSSKASAVAVRHHFSMGSAGVVLHRSP